MNAFTYKNGELYAEDVAVDELAECYGTPIYVYSRGYLQEQYRALAVALSELNPTIFYSLKANSNAAVIETFVEEGSGADVVSGGELFRALRAGVDPTKIAFAGVGKSEREIDYALKQEILYFTVESEPELERISACARAIGKPGRIAIRVNPDVDPKTHKYTSTGKKENKFGVDLERAARVYERAAALPGIEIAGLHMHLGSLLMSPDPYVEALEKVGPLCAKLQAGYPGFRHIDIGGGFGIAYRPDEQAPTAEAFAEALVPPLKTLGLHVGLEPGRFLTGNAGVLVTRVEYVKKSPIKKFVIVDAAMNDLIRPALYQGYHEIHAVRQTDQTFSGDLVGPVCESGDFLAADRELPVFTQDDLLAVMSAGAYGYVMASNYNSRGRPAEVMVSGKRHALVRERETWEKLVEGETMPEWQSK